MVWGLFISLLLIVGMARIPFSYGINIPACMLGFLIIYSGIVPLALLHGLSPKWPAFSRGALILGLLILYFTPFIFWWSVQPNEIYYAINGVACMISIIALLAVLNHMAALYAQRVEDEAFRLEARLSMWAVVGIYGLPLVYALIFSAGFMIRHHSNPLAQIRLSLSTAWPFLVMMGSIPLVLTGLNLWKMRQKCIELIRQ